MKLITERTVGPPVTNAKPGEVVVVGLKFDAESRELLTWCLMKAANPGDRVIAVHVLQSISGGAASLLSLVKTFDSLLAVYEGFCNLKQVDLKLKVCRGSSARKGLVKEAKSSGASKVIVGTSKSHSRIRSSASVAKYCARNLSQISSVFAYNSGKIIFQREIFSSEKLSSGSGSCLETSENENSVEDLPNSMLQNDSGTDELLEETIQGGDVDNSLAVVPFQTSEAMSNVNSALIKRSRKPKHGWSILQRVFLSKRPDTDKSGVKKNPIVKWVLKIPSWNSSSVVYPDKKQSIAGMKEYESSNLDGETGSIVAKEGPLVPWSSISPSHASNEIQEELKGLHEKYSFSCKLFSYEELRVATSNFKPENMVGKGGSSHVYRGCLPDGKALAVKILKASQDLLQEFVAEIEIITTLHHKNIISLYGFCFEQNNLLLVFEFLSRGSLEENLHGIKKDSIALGWQERYKVAVGVAEALDYLHSHCDHPVIHRDVKSSNVLLSEDFEPQLSDFGLATRDSTSSSQIISTDVAGTFGYLAPEYFMHGKVSDKVDVFAFGVVLLELLSGRMPIDDANPKGLESLVIWAKPILEGGNNCKILDPRIGSKCDDSQIESMILAATLCIRRSPAFRPQINFVLKLLQGDKEATDWARKQVSESAQEVDHLEEDEEAFPINIQSHLNLALLDLETDSVSVSSTEPSVSLEDYLEHRWSRASSFS